MLDAQQTEGIEGDRRGPRKKPRTSEQPGKWHGEESPTSWNFTTSDTPNGAVNTPSFGYLVLVARVGPAHMWPLYQLNMVLINTTKKTACDDRLPPCTVRWSLQSHGQHASGWD